MQKQQWHSRTTESILEQLDTSPSGLSKEEVHSRLISQGPNSLLETPPRSALKVFLGQFKSIIILILIGAAFLAAFIGNIKDALVIIAVVVINASVGFYQEYRAEQSLTALKGMLPSKTYARRDGETSELGAEQLVTGDIVVLEAGDRVPADGRLLIAEGLEIDESALTGESRPVAKQITELSDSEIPLGDQSNMVFMNTMLTRGRAELVVTATGMQTEMGKISQELASAVEPLTPLQIQLDHLGKRLGIIALTLVGLLAFIEFLRGTNLSHIALEAIALAVAAMPEGLPVVVTVTLALGMHKLAKQNAIVKRLASVETLGCTTVICSDKTGTLTLNQMMVREFFYQNRHFKVSGNGYLIEGTIIESGTGTSPPNLDPLLIPLAACNDSKVTEGKVIGDPMEGALLVLAAKGGVDLSKIADAVPRIAEITFAAERKYMVTFHRQGEQVLMFAKGAPDVLLPICENWLAGEQAENLTEAKRNQIDQENLSLANAGLRGLMVASRTIPAHEFDPSCDLLGLVNKLTFIGLIGFVDPPRTEAKESIAQCQQAGIAVKMITGDHKGTGLAIAKELGLEGNAITGQELDQLDAAQLAAAIDNITVFARVNPTHKVKIVRALQAKHHVVAMTGDGVNDAPALKCADIGVAMGISGTAVAKEAATMVLVDDNFSSIVRAVRHGRTLYDNILKFVRFQLSTTIGAILTVFFAPLAGLPDLFTPTQILWVAIIMDGPPAVSLALDAARPGIMLEPPRHRSESILPISRLTKIFAFGITMMLGTLAVLHYGMHSGTEQRALSLAFTTFVLFQVFNVFNARNEIGSTFNLAMFNNLMLWVSLSCVVALQIIAVHWLPAAKIFATGGMNLEDWIIATAVASSILVLEEGRKLIVLLLTRR